MKLTVLLDNHSLIDRYFLAEPGVSYFIETEGKKILFDVGYSDAFISNARKMAIDLWDLDYLVLSHGHLDHTWGLIPLIQLYTQSIFEGKKFRRPTLVTHPMTLIPKTIGDLPEIGFLLTPEQLEGYFDLQLSKAPVFLTERLVFLGEIERKNDFEARDSIGKTRQVGVEVDDYLLDDSALAYQASSGLVIITGCSHSGICNIVEQAKATFGDDRVVDIIGGFHLLDPSEQQLQGTLAYLQALRPAALHACHCTDLRSKIALSKIGGLKEVGVGLGLEF